MTKLLSGGENIAASLGLDEASLTKAILDEALPVFERGGEIYAALRQLACWQSTNLADLFHEPCPQWYEHVRGALTSLMRSDVKEAAWC